MTPESTIRPATSDDAPAIADVFLTAFRDRYDFALAHSDDEVRGWIADVLVPGSETWVADAGGQVVGFMALGDQWVEQLYVAPGHTGRGLGSRLLALAKERRPGGLKLYTFQVNAGARRFYERHGFRAVAFNDGSNNEEGQPDVQYAWSGEPDERVSRPTDREPMLRGTGG